MGETLTVTTADNRTLDVLVMGPEGAPVVVYHHGTPSAPVEGGPMDAPAAAAGVRLVQYARPGYALSTPQPGRTVASAVADTEAVVAAIGGADYIAIGVSGGGPHALACAALSTTCRAAASVAGAAPYGVPDLDFLAGMGQDNIDEFGAALKGVAALEELLNHVAPSLADVTAEGVIEAMSGLLPTVDKDALTGDLGDWLARSCRRALSSGIAGWRDDDLGFVAPWGFSVSEIAVPVGVWQGEQDLMVPYAHGSWLAAHIPTAQPHLYSDHGHLSIAAAHMTEILANTLELGAG
jgi:pimeloyl-ACP methyl ester carboxylesterase